MRKYTTRAELMGDDFDDEVYEIDGALTTEQFREEYYYLEDNPTYWAKLDINGHIYYSNEDIFETEKEDATHIVVSIK